MRIEDIKIKDSFKHTYPSDAKLNACREYFKQHGTIDRQIVVNKNGYLVDGYIGYLVLCENGVNEVTVSCVNHVRTEKDVYVFGRHSGNGKEYIWRLSNRARNRHISVGSKVLVDTKFGVKTAIVTKVEASFIPPADMPIKRVIRCLKE